MKRSLKLAVFCHMSRKLAVTWHDTERSEVKGCGGHQQLRMSVFSPPTCSTCDCAGRNPAASGLEALYLGSYCFYYRLEMVPGSGWNSDLSTTGAGQPMKSRLKVPRVLHSEPKIHLAQRQSPEEAWVSNFLPVPPRKTKLPCAEKPSVRAAGT